MPLSKKYVSLGHAGIMDLLLIYQYQIFKKYEKGVDRSNKNYYINA